MCPCDHHTNSMGLHTCSHLSPKSSWWWFPITAGLYHNLLNQALVEGHLGFPLPLLQLTNNAEMTAMLSHFSRVRLCAIPWTAAHQAPPSLGFSRQEYWSGLPFPSLPCDWVLANGIWAIMTNALLGPAFIGNGCESPLRSSSLPVMRLKHSSDNVDKDTTL